MTDQPITTIDDLLTRLAASRMTGDGDTTQRLVTLGTSWALDADLDAEFAHYGIYWDAASPEEVADADAVEHRAMADLDQLLADPAIKAEYEKGLQGQHYREMRAERTREPSLSDEDA
ncbi:MULTISPECIES: hypothetical protein [Methylobacteriaceae]|uniref:hypothetical protein n=1 Tax=Methylobacteriaceae TaxID=119045 RepID=UPI00116DDC26|nr:MULTISPECIES: hypothetical protein [Methylobacteriaceae]GEL44425.1 hypothetical protein MEX01_50160 [Methylorubrum extorquens]